MSSGECLLVSLLHFIYNALIRRSLPVNEPVLMLIDEIELALHPVAVSRLIDLLNNIIKEHDNLTVVLTSHSPEVIRKISPNNLFMMEVDEKIQLNFIPLVIRVMRFEMYICILVSTMLFWLKICLLNMLLKSYTTEIA